MRGKRQPLKSQAKDNSKGIKRVGSLIPNAELYMKNEFNVMLIGKHGTGKALPNYSNVLTDKGWNSIGSLKINDNIVGRNGQIYAVTGVFPQGEKSVVEMHFSDGTIIECCEDHLWTFHSRANRNNENEMITKPASFFLDNIFSSRTKSSKENPQGQAKWYLPKVQPIEFPEQELFIDPYALGLLIGDGSFRQQYEIRYSTGDVELIPSIEQALGVPAQKDTGYDYRFSGISQTIIPALKENSLHQKYSHEKHIPQEYLFSSVEQRLALLQGLLDSDGSPNGSAAEFSTTSLQLANDVKNIVHSLGGVSTLKSRTTSYTHGEKKLTGKLSYRLFIRLDMPLFRLERKQKLLKPFQKAHRRLVGVVKTERIEEMTCISVNSPDKLFLTENFTPTHNTESILELARQMGWKVKYYSCGTLDPYTDLVGVPVPRKNEDTAEEFLKMIRPKEVDDADLIFFDELNRADPKVLNAVFEIIQFGTINGEKLNNLKCCWAAINPPDEGYEVDELDPALLDRFDIFHEIQPAPSVAYMSQYISQPIAQALKYWWDDQNRKKRKDGYISPRRLMKLGLIWEATKSERSLKAAIPPGVTTDVQKLVELLKDADDPQRRAQKRQANIGTAAAQFSYHDRNRLFLERDKLAKHLAKNPNELETHKRVLDTLAKGVGGEPLIDTWGHVLNNIQPTLLEGWINKFPGAKQSQMRTRLKTELRNANANKTKAHFKKKKGVVYNILAKGAGYGMPTL